MVWIADPAPVDTMRRDLTRSRFPRRNRVRHLTRVGTAAWVLFVAFAALSHPVEAAAGPGRVTDRIGPAHISPALDAVRVRGAAYDRARRDLDDLVAKTRSDTEALAQTNREIRSSDYQRGRLQRRIFTATTSKATVDEQIPRLRARLARLALRAYVGADDTAARDSVLTLDSDAFLQTMSSVTLRRTVTNETHETYERLVATSQRLGRQIEADRADLAATESALTQANARATALTSDLADDSAATVRAMQRVRDTKATAFVEGTDLPLVALDAYFHGAQIARLVEPGCHLGWPLLAGIGAVESGQGSYGGAALLPDGTLTRPIYGMSLDGTQGNETILMPDGSYMRAEGPMQFLPSTWAAVAVDGDGDHVVDIQNLYDAAATAAVFLCDKGGDLVTDSGLRRAILAYNFSGDYVARVSAAMRDYAEALPDVAAS